MTLMDTFGMYVSSATEQELGSIKKIHKLMKAKGCKVSDTYKSSVPDWFA